MNIFDRIQLSRIEGYSIKDVRRILNDEESDYLPKVDSIVFNSILLTNGKTIRCVSHYYKNSDSREVKSKSKCPMVQKFFGISCSPYDCVRCHKIMLDKRNNKEVKPR